MTNLVFFLQNSILLLPNGDFWSFILPQSSLLFELRTPEGLDAVHGRTQLAFFHLHILAEQIVFPQHLLELRLQVHDGVIPGLAQRVRHSGCHAHWGEMVLSKCNGITGNSTSGNVRAAAHGSHPNTVRQPPPRPAQGHGALRGVCTHVLVVT